MDRQELLKQLNQFPYDRNECWVITGGAMVLYGIKEQTTDIDLGCSTRMADLLDAEGYLYRRMDNGKRWFKYKDTIEIFEGWLCDTFEMLEGFPVISIKGLIEMKQELGREKDRKDIELIKAFLKQTDRSLERKKSMSIRKATGEEMLSLWGYEDIEKASYTAKFFYQNISSGNAVFWTLDHDGELIGELYAFLDLDDKDFADGTGKVYLCAFRVKEEYRGQGLGSSLMEKAIAELKENGFRTATIGVAVDEPQNIKLYHRMGFTKKIKDCNYDPCGFNAYGQQLYEEAGWWLLSKEL